MMRPTAVDPVKLTLSTPGARPGVPGFRGTGNHVEHARRKTALEGRLGETMASKAVSGEALSTTVQPAASAGAI